jgi:tetratricopeptide (TPR) repeat protein
VIKGSPWERLCVGFFGQRNQADSLLKDFQQLYPGAWIQKASTGSISSTIAMNTAALSSTAKTAPAAKPPVTSKTANNTTRLTEQQLDSLMQRARADFKNKDYDSSIRYLNALTATGTHGYSQEALELLGLARQRKGQKSHAADAYDRYLALDPDSDGADRVRQRLAGLMTATSSPAQTLPMSTLEEKDEVTSCGSLSQFYQNNRTSADDIGTISTVSQLISFLDLTTLQRTANFDHRYQLTADHVYDFIDDDDDSEFRFIETYYELSYRQTGSSGRIGRQRLQIGGILKRFDGISFGYQFDPNLRLNVLGGLPVDIDNKTSINQHKTFYGFTFETGTFLEHWSMNLFYFDQRNDGLQESNNIGTEMRYRDSRKAFFGLIDYDLFYDELNILQFNGNLFLDHGRTAFINAYLHQSPLLATTNALIGRQEQSIEELKKVLNIEQIYQLARDRTASSETFTVGGSQPLSEDFQLTADITFAHVSETVSSGGAPATPDTGTEYYINAQLVGNSIFRKYDTNILGVRYYQTDPSDTISFIANARFPITRKWRVNPRLQYDMRNFIDGRSQQKLRAILRTDYRYLNTARFDFEIGYDDVSEDDSSQYLGNSNIFFTLGYRWDF